MAIHYQKVEAEMDKERLIKELEKILSPESIIWADDELITYECDGLTVDKAMPDAVVLPTSAEQVSEIVKLANRENVPFTPRGSGTGLSGGSLPVKGGIVIALSRMDKILSVDLENRIAVVEPGVTNLRLTEAVADQGYCYLPDPSSQQVCTIGGNVAENAGGAHCLKYGVTTNYILGLELVLPDGDIVQIGGETLDLPGYDLVGLMVGSEGTLGIVTKVIVRLSHKPEAVKTLLAIFRTIDDAGKAVSEIIGAGIIPVALEMMDRVTMEAVEAATHAGYPTDAEAVLIIELDGPKDGMERLVEHIVKICGNNNVQEIKVAINEEEGLLLWAGRKSAFGAIGRISPSFFVQDGVVPRTKLPEALRRIDQIGEKYSLKIANVFHAGDGNLHPLILLDERDREQVERALKASSEILETCVDLGGTISGEHGIGFEKRDGMKLIFGSKDLETMMEIRSVFNPKGLCNPEKIFRTPVESEAGGPEPKAVPAQGEALIHRIGEIAGDSNVLSWPEAEEYAIDGAIPKAVVFPESAEQISEIMVLANRERASIVPRGGGTKMSLGRIPRSVDIVLSTSRLKKVLEHEHADLVAIVQGGVVLSDLQRFLAREGQFLTLDPPHSSSATIGGIIATNSNGPERLLYGSARDLVIGMKVVRPNGDILKAGGRVVKNVAGYDMSKLYIGSLGTLGVIVEATFRLRPLPESHATLVACFHSVSSAMGSALGILGSNLIPSAVEILNPRAFEQMAENVNLPSLDCFTLLTRAEGVEEAVQSQIARMSEMCGEALWREVLDGGKDEELWGAARDLLGTTGVICKADVLPSQVEEMLQASEEIGEKHGLKPTLISHAGNGIVYIHLPEGGNEIGRLVDTIADLRARAHGIGGSLVVESAPPPVKAEIDVWGRSGDDLRLMHAIKSKIDSKDILNPGRFVGGM